MKDNVINIQTNKINRNSSIELLRIIAMLMILFHHFAIHGGFEFYNTSITIPRLWYGLIVMGGKIGVVIFVLISGYFLIDSNTLTINWKKSFKLWSQIIFYSIVLFLIIEGAINFNFIKSIFPITFSQWWFASTYFIMYLLHPYFNKFLHSLTKSQYQYFLLLLVIIWSVVPTFTTKHMESNVLIQFFMFYSIAGYLRIYGLNERIKNRHYLITCIISMMILYLSYLVFIIIGIKIPFFSKYATYFYKSNSILVILSAVCCFMFFVTRKIKYHPYINKIASAAFGVYLIHDSILLRPILWIDIFKNASFQNSNWIILYSICVVILVYCICTIIDLLRQWIFEKAILKFGYRFIDIFESKFNCISEKIKYKIFGEIK